MVVQGLLMFRDSPQEGRGRAQECAPGAEKRRAYRRAERLKAMCAVRIKSSLIQKRGC